MATNSETKIKFGNIDFSSYGVYVWGEGEYSSPARNVEFVPVVGRNGSLLIDKGNYLNSTASFNVTILEDVPKNTDRLKYLLYSQKGYQRLFDSSRKGFYRVASFNRGFNIETNEYGVVNVQFDCKPYWYDILGDDPLTENLSGSGYSGSIYNKYFEPSRPIVNLVGTGNATVSIGNYVINITDVPGTIVIDTEMQDAFKGSAGNYQNLNGIIDTADLKIEPGYNTISVIGSGLTQFRLTPRWVTL